MSSHMGRLRWLAAPAAVAVVAVAISSSAPATATDAAPEAARRVAPAAGASAADGRPLAEDFAVLRRSPTGGRGMPPRVAARFPADAVAEARMIDTSHGPGWVIPDPAGDQVCLAIPDVVDGYGYTCQPAAAARQGRLSGEMVAAAPGGLSEYVGVLPDTASTPSVQRETGRAEPVRDVDGVIVVATRGSARLTFDVPGAASVVVSLAPEPQGRLTQDCGDGRIIEVERVLKSNCG